MYQCAKDPSHSNFLIDGESRDIKHYWPAHQISLEADLILAMQINDCQAGVDNYYLDLYLHIVLHFKGKQPVPVAQAG